MSQNQIKMIKAVKNIEWNLPPKKHNKNFDHGPCQFYIQTRVLILYVIIPQKQVLSVTQSGRSYGSQNRNPLMV